MGLITVGAVMTLSTGGETNFKPRPIEGTPDKANTAEPEELLLDGQQRITSLYQMTLRNKVIETVTSRQKKGQEMVLYRYRKGSGCYS